ncbi:MAG: hypothetical protein KA807_06375, partial [Prolixibacteraceae bacterium]|nr:hypothetical protein [Prolixibacteraceae bacterium]
MRVSIVNSLGVAFIKKATKILIYILFSFVFLSKSFGQAPGWYVGPSVTATGPFSITCNYGINMQGTIYIVAYENNQTIAFTGAEIKLRAESGINPPRIATFIIPVNAGNVNTALQTVISGLKANTYHTVYFAAESSSGVLQPLATRLAATTWPCPPIYVLTGFPIPSVCVNKGQLAIFTIELPDTDPLTPGKQTDVNKT